MTKVQGPAKVIRRSSTEKRTFSGGSNGTVDILSLLAQQCTAPGTPDGPPSPPQEREAEPQYLGSTSYSAVFLENRDSIGAEVGGDASNNDADFSDPECIIDRLRLAVSILKAIPDQDTCEMLFDCSFEYDSSPLHEPAARYYLQSLWETYGDTLRDRGNDHKLKGMAMEVLRNTDTPIKAQRTSAEWLESHTGRNARFEIIGLLLCIFALALPILPNDHVLFRHGGISPRQYQYRIGFGAECSRNICSDMAIVNEFTLYLDLHIQVVQSLYRGDESKCPTTCSINSKLIGSGGFYWRKSGHVATSVTALGFHREGTIVKSAPFMVAEIRKRMFIACFIVDKQLATLLGRPPRLSRRYSNCSLPLDLKDQEIMLQSDALSQKLSHTDFKGWNTKGKVTRVGCLRGMMISALIRDEILELCLGPEPECTPQRRE